MGIGNYLAKEAEFDAGTMKGTRRHIIRTSIATFLAFISFGMLPLVPYLIGITDAQYVFLFSICTTVFALITLGIMKWFVIKKNLFRSILKTVFIGGVAAFVAFIVGVMFRV